MDFIISDGRIWNIPFLSLPSEFEFRFVVPVFHRYARNEMFPNVSRFHCRMKDSTKSRWWASLVLWNGAWKRLSLWIIQSGPWKIRAMNGSPSCTGRIRRFALSCILDERRRAEGRKEDTRDMKFWSQVYVGSGIGSYPDPVAARCERMRENLVCQRVNCPIPD